MYLLMAMRNLSNIKLNLAFPIFIQSENFLLPTPTEHPLIPQRTTLRMADLVISQFPVPVTAQHQESSQYDPTNMD